MWWMTAEWHFLLFLVSVFASSVPHYAAWHKGCLASVCSSPGFPLGTEKAADEAGEGRGLAEDESRRMEEERRRGFPFMRGTHASSSSFFFSIATSRLRLGGSSLPPPPLLLLLFFTDVFSPLSGAADSEGEERREEAEGEARKREGEGKAFWKENGAPPPPPPPLSTQERGLGRQKGL